jgi:hypothetical protein
VDRAGDNVGELAEVTSKLGEEDKIDGGEEEKEGLTDVSLEKGDVDLESMSEE